MARYEIDEEPLYFKPHVPGKVVVSRPLFITLCIFAVVGAAFMLMVIFA